MITARVRALIAELGAKTAESKIAWKETSESGVYQVSFPSSSVQVLRTGSDIIFRLYNESGDLVEEVDDNGIDGRISGMDPYTFMAGLLDGARQSAFGADRIIDDILNTLRET